MGVYSTLQIDGYELFSIKNGYEPLAMMLFTGADKKVWTPEPSEPELSDELTEGPPEEIEAHTHVVYEAELFVVKDRLDFMGITLPYVRRVFQEAVEQIICDHELSNPAPWWVKPEDRDKWREQERVILESMTLDRWIDALSYILREQYQPDYGSWHSNDDECQRVPQLARYIANAGIWFPICDPRVIVRAAAEVDIPNLTVVYDLSELVIEEMIDPKDDLCDWTRRDMVDEAVINHKVIVLTEGSIDQWAIESALQILYPHLAGYYSFIDFQAARVQGGAGPLVSLIKAFVGAGIVNRVVALFDNDTAARDAVRSLKEIKLPQSVRVLHYPSVDWAADYPTLGPQGTVNMDVNGLAGGIELYYGLDILRQADGTLTPVQWRGYISSLGDYQGELINKAGLRDLYAAKLAACRNDQNEIARYDWSGMKTILNLLLSSFHDT